MVYVTPFHTNESQDVAVTLLDELLFMVRFKTFISGQLFPPIKVSLYIPETE